VSNLAKEKANNEVSGEDVIEELKNVEALEEVTVVKKVEAKPVDTSGWKPKTELGRKVKAGEITKVDDILDEGKRILEIEIVDTLIPGLQTDLLLIGQAKGKFGGGQRRVFKQTQKKTSEGNKPKFATYAVVGNKDGIVGVGYGKSKETVPAREKAIRNAKLSIFKIRRGCGSWVCGCKEPHSIPFEVKGKCGSSEMVLKPAPKGSGLVIEKECQKILKMAGINDVFSKTFGQTTTKTNLIGACINALKNLTEVKINPELIKELGVVEGSIGTTPEEIKTEEKNGAAEE
jgi:small subunit ribosomal protein S5